MAISLDGTNNSIVINNITAMSVDASGRILKPNHPIFQAYGVSQGWVTSTYMIYPTTLINQGSNYNTTTGRFTAPIAGAYHFFWSHIGGNSDNVWRYYFRKNGSNIATEWQLRLDTNESGSGYGFGTREIIIPLAAGDYVQIFFLSDTGTNAYPGVADNTNTYPTFGGYLLG